MSKSLCIDIQTESLNVTEAILERYNVPGPRYTSYPTAPEWVDPFGPSDFERACTEAEG
jgi:oxygen-independent coproporphyrinogen-3 oxidase